MENFKAKIKRIMSVVLVLSLCLFTLSGCKKETSEDKVRAALAENAKVAESMKTSGDDKSKDSMASSEEEVHSEDPGTGLKEKTGEKLSSEENDESQNLKNVADIDSYESPVDFASLYEQNQDICAWLFIPNTDISYPILKSESDQAFYLDHDSLGGKSDAGSLFIDDYNQADFTDPVTVIYGHRTAVGDYFSQLQPVYGDAESFKNHREMTLYLPKEERQYQVFAAVPYDMIHILYNYDFSNVAQFFVFFDNIFGVRALNANLVKEDYPKFGEKILILSTCLLGDNTQRFLVLAKEI